MVVEVGGVRVGYLRAVFVPAAGNFDAAFEALDAKEPIAIDLSRELGQDEELLWLW